MNIFKGITLTAFLSFSIALLFAFIFRLPIPMVGVIGPFGEYGPTSNVIETIYMVITAWIFYGVLGGFIVIAILGGFAGYLASKSQGVKPSAKIVQYSFLAALIPVLFISTLDFIIGPW